jgi:hypothetical protein
LEDHEGHARAEKDDVGGLVVGEEFVFKVSGGAGYQRWVRFGLCARLIGGTYSSQNDIICD